MKCSICGNEIHGYGNNPAPLRRSECCDECNSKVILPLRFFLCGSIKERALLIKPDGAIETLKSVNGEIPLKDMQQAVDGYVEFYPKRDDLFHFVVNEEGLLKHLPFNSLAHELFNIEVVGNLLVVPKGLIE